MSKIHAMLVTLTAAAFMAPLSSRAAIDVSGTSPAVTENFNSMWSEADAAPSLSLPDGWRVDRNTTAPRKLSTWTDASSEVMYSGGVSLASNAKNGTWNFGSSSDSSDRAVGGLTTTVSNGTRGINLMTCLHNADPSLIVNGLDISYSIEKYRKGANAAGFAVQLYYSADGETWTSAGDDFYTLFDPDSETLGAADVPISTTPVAANLRIHTEPGQDIYLAWNISVATGTSPDKAPGLALDDISVTASFTDNDSSWEEPDQPVRNPSGIFLRGEVNGWAADSDWEFDKTDTDGVYQLLDKTLSGGFKVADSSWSSACNYGSNGSSAVMGVPYELVLGTNDNISCGGNTYICSRILLTIQDGAATLTLEPNDDATGLTAVYMVGDFNSWNYMDKSGQLSLDSNDSLFKGRITMTAAADGLSHWRLYQRLAMAGAWGLPADATESALSGSLVKGEKGNAAVPVGTYEVTFDLNSGAYTFTQVESSPVEMTLRPAETILVPSLPAQVKVLSLNNSLIHYNDQSAVFNEIADAMGSDAEWTKHTLLGKSLATHWEEGDGLADDGLPGAKMMVRSQPWSHIILQEQSSLPRTNVEAFRANVSRWVEYIRANCPNPNAVIILPVNWAYSGDWDNFTQFNNKFAENYIDVALDYGLTICPVASAYQAVYDKEGTAGIASWFQDDRHPTDKSTYLAACMEYGLIYGVDPLEINYAPSAVSESEAADMRQYASDALKAWSNNVDHNAGKVRLDVKVTDEFGISLDPGELSFTVDNDGVINDAREFSATTPGLYNITVSNGTFTRTATVTVAEPVTEMPLIPAVSLNADNLEYSQNFDSMGSEATAALPEGWRIDRQTSAPRAVGTFRTADDATMYAGGVSLPSNAKNGTWNFGDNSGDDRAVGGITTGVANGSRAVNVYAHFVNDGLKKLENIRLSYDVEKYRDGNNAAGFTVKLFYSADGTNWTEAGPDFVTDFAAASQTAGFETVPAETIAVSGTLPASLGAGCDLYLAWNISVTSGDNCAGAPALAIDNAAITASLPEVPVYSYYIYVEDQTGYDAMGAYAYGSSEIWGSWPGQAPIDVRDVDGCRYKVFGHNQDTGNYNLIINNWNRSLQLPDFPFEGGRDYWLLATSSKVTEKDTSAVKPIFAGKELKVSFEGKTIKAPGAASISVYDVAGKVAARAAAEQLTLPAAPGLYLVHASSPTATVTLKILVK